MKLLDPGLGEIWDRLTILSLKIVNRRLLGSPVGHWEAERQGLIDPSVYTPLLQVLELGAVNAALWQREDDLRRDRGGPVYVSQQVVLATLAVEIQELNDRRAELVALINAQAGQATEPEK